MMFWHFRVFILCIINDSLGARDWTILQYSSRREEMLHCKDSVEDEVHVLLQCPLYNDLPFSLLGKCRGVCETFSKSTDLQKASYILTNPDIQYSISL